jgi:hypothetical protein
METPEFLAVPFLTLNSKVIVGNPEVFRDPHSTTDKCRRHRHRKLIRFSAEAPRAGFSFVLAECAIGVAAQKKLRSLMAWVACHERA